MQSNVLVSVPLHVQQTDLARMEKDLDDRRLVATLFLGEADRVDANQLPIVGGADESFECVDDRASLGETARELVQPLREELVVEGHRLIFAESTDSAK